MKLDPLLLRAKYLPFQSPIFVVYVFTYDVHFGQVIKHILKINFSHIKIKWYPCLTFQFLQRQIIL